MVFRVWAQMEVHEDILTSVPIQAFLFRISVKGQELPHITASTVLNPILTERGAVIAAKRCDANAMLIEVYIIMIINVIIIIIILLLYRLFWAVVDIGLFLYMYENSQKVAETLEQNILHKL